MSTHLHPIIAWTFRHLGFPEGAAPPLTREQRIEGYVSGLQVMDWRFEGSDDQRHWMRMRDHLVWLRKQQAELDPDAAIWRQHAPAGFLLAPPELPQ